jgi:ABC-type glycerol-3-phosphate transport system permease component
MSRLARLVAPLASLAVAGIFLAPLLWMLLASFREESRIFQAGAGGWFEAEGWTLSHYADAWRRASLGRGLLNSALQVLLIAGGGLVVNTTAAYAFARLRFPGREACFAGLVTLIVLPIEVLAVPLLFTVRDLGLSGGSGAAMTALTLPFFAKAFNIYFLRQHFLAVPRALEEAAVMDGAGPWRLFWNVALPAVKPALATVVVLDLLAHWGDFLWPLLVATREESRTVQLSLANLFTQPPVRWGDILAGSVLATLPVLFGFRWLQRHIVPAEARAGIK